MVNIKITGHAMVINGSTKVVIVFVRCYNISRHLNDNKCSDDFKRRLYYAQNFSLKLVHYVGDETAYIPQPHATTKAKIRDSTAGHYHPPLQTLVAKVQTNSPAKFTKQWWSTDLFLACTKVSKTPEIPF